MARALGRFGAWYVNGCSSSLAALGHPDLTVTAPGVEDDLLDLHTYARHGVADLEAWLSRQAVGD